MTRWLLVYKYLHAVIIQPARPTVTAGAHQNTSRLVTSRTRATEMYVLTPQTFVIRLPENISKTADSIRYCPSSHYGTLPNTKGREFFRSYLPHYKMNLWRPNSWNEPLTKPVKEDAIYKLRNSESVTSLAHSLFVLKLWILSIEYTIQGYFRI